MPVSIPKVVCTVGPAYVRPAGGDAVGIRVSEIFNDWVGILQILSFAAHRRFCFMLRATSRLHSVWKFLFPNLPTASIFFCGFMNLLEACFMTQIWASARPAL